MTTARLVLVAAGALAVWACSDGAPARAPQNAPAKPLPDQCNDLSKVLGAEQPKVRDDLLHFKDKARPEDFYAAADRLKKSGDAVGAVPLADAKLASARDQYAKIYEDLASDANLAAAGIQGNDAERKEQALKDAAKRIADEHHVIDDINGICKAPASSPSAAPSVSASAAPAAK